MRLSRVPVLAKIAVLVVGIYVLLRFAIYPPLPSSIIFLYMALTVISIWIYMVLFVNLREILYLPLQAFLSGRLDARWGQMVRWMILLTLPFATGVWGYQNFGPKMELPFEQRVVHPSPPPEFMGLYNPYRVEDPQVYRRFVVEGAEVYFKNCFFCHGDKLDGKGLFAKGVNPPPANLMDPGTIAQLQESYVSWRINQGGVGLPPESAPWNSAMPKWEHMLTEEEQWKVILFLYDYTGHTPRTWE